jgi:hypothetical protein
MRNGVARRSPGLYGVGLAFRAVAACAVLLAWYFLAPLDRPWSAATGAGLGIGLLLICVGGGWQIRAVMRSPYPRMRAAGALLLSFPPLVLLFATSYLLLAQDDPQAFTERLTRLDALYLAMTVVSTVGFGDIAPVSAVARVLVMAQMLADLVFVGFLVRALVEAARLGTQRREAEPKTRNL